jgi:hypothetical protein
MNMQGGERENQKAKGKKQKANGEGKKPHVAC